MAIFQSFGQMLGADPHRLAADAMLSTFAYQPIVGRHHLDQVLRGFCAEKGPSFLGMAREVLPVEICEARSILIWQRAMAASTRVRTGDYSVEELILLDHRLMSMDPLSLAQHFRLA